jgi:aminotransferase EvaB
LHAEILRRRLRRIGRYIDRRQALARRYDEQLQHTDLVRPVTRSGNRHVFHQYVVRHPAREAIIASLAAQGITVGIHYPWPIHMMPAYRQFGAGEGSLPVTERAAREIFSLPMYPSLSNVDQDRVCEALRVSLRSAIRTASS